MLERAFGWEGGHSNWSPPRPGALVSPHSSAVLQPACGARASSNSAIGAAARSLTCRLLNLAELLAGEGHAAEAARIAKLGLAVVGRMLRAGGERAVEALREIPHGRREGFLERLRRLADPDGLYSLPGWSHEDRITASFWNKEKPPETDDLEGIPSER